MADIGLTNEGRTPSMPAGALGWVATCKVCGWERWEELKPTAEQRGREHACRKGDRCRACRPAARKLGGDGCPHFTPKTRT